MRCARSSACCKSDAFHETSTKTTRCAAVSVRPVPAAVMERMAARTDASSWKEATRSHRTSLGVCPSMRMYCTPASWSAAPRPSSTTRWCAKHSSLPRMEASASRTHAAAGASLTEPEIVRRAVSSVESRARLFAPPRGAAASASCQALARASASPSLAGWSQAVRRVLGGKVASTSVLSRRTSTVAVSTWWSSSTCDLPDVSQPNRPCLASQ
mmetsp:Transcript_10530/g.31206  ORF Transcript_10530/g.31206 Transcript_10530/m.31206 type:complete len:213 (-) Transcript_10530:484-1122(-)